MDRKQQQMVAINRGLFLVRYAAAEDEARPPRVAVAVDSASTKDLSFFLHPDHKEAVLWQPDTCLVVRALAAGKLSVQIIPAQAGGSTAATVRIEPIHQAKVTPAATSRKTPAGAPPEHGDIRILGHVSGTGDVLVNANEWLAGPSAPSRIEGLSIAWPGKPADLDIQYTVKTARPQATSGRKMSLGSFAGTRGKAMPIVGLMLELSGPGAANFQWSIEAIFLGSPTKRITGKRVVASGPTGREPLVGLRLAVEKLLPAVEKTRPAVRPQKKPAASKPARSEGRVRVYRSRAKHTQPAIV